MVFVLKLIRTLHSGKASTDTYRTICCEVGICAGLGWFMTSWSHPSQNNAIETGHARTVSLLLYQMHR